MAMSNAFAYAIIDERLNLGEQKPVGKSAKRKVVEPDTSLSSIDRNDPFPFQLRQTKWRRLENLEENGKQQSIATSRTNPSLATADLIVGDKSHAEAGALNECGDFTNADDSVDPIDDRLNLLQRLVPRGSEVDTEEILKVVVDYVKALEREIQMFHDSVQNVPATVISNSGVKGIPGDSMDKPSKPGNFLQERGLCVVPLSILSKAF